MSSNGALIKRSLRPMGAAIESRRLPIALSDLPPSAYGGWNFSAEFHVDQAIPVGTPALCFGIALQDIGMGVTEAVAVASRENGNPWGDGLNKRGRRRSLPTVMRHDENIAMQLLPHSGNQGAFVNGFDIARQ